MRGRRSPFRLNPALLLSYVATQGKVTRAKARRDHPLYTSGQVTYWLDRLHEQGKLRRHRGKRGAFVYTFKHH